ncbi:hypothetical protein [Brevundimonas vesicularis]|uniref:hypothetical protein n=1 Tax=Brevundimonas vesicularis TaxID=41276 RepID=UPI000ADFA716|nr:hypothetical protein [Brevundimonas vesicularis]
MAQQITKMRVETSRLNTPKRRRFADTPVVKKNDTGQYTIGTLFPCIDRMFEEENHIYTREGKYGPYAFLKTPHDISKATRWQDDRKHLIFLRDTLTFSIAIDFNLESAGVYTALGRAEHEAKTNHDAKSVGIIADAVTHTVGLLKPYSAATLLCAVPPCPSKSWDLPSAVIAQVAAQTGKPAVNDLAFANKKQSVKSLSVADKWDALEAAGLTAGPSVIGKRVILFDDKYQSGMTLQFVASKLLEAGATDVYGLCAVKTWRDTDNT